MSEREYTGGCQCGAVRYKATGEALYVSYCHCSDCRLSSGAPVVAWAGFPSGRLAFTQGEPGAYASSPNVTRRFCARCGTSLTYQIDDQPEVDVTLASLDDPNALAPTQHVFTASKLDWVRISDDLPQYRRWKHEG